MNTDINPGAPATDELARNAAINAISCELLNSGVSTNPGLTDRIGYALAAMHAITWETDINANGVPVRRYVLRGEWEVDPTPPAYIPEKGDVVRLLGDEPVMTNDGEFPADAEWIISAVPFTVSHDPDYTLILLRQPSWAEGKYINATAGTVEILRRPR